MLLLFEFLSYFSFNSTYIIYKVNYFFRKNIFNCNQEVRKWLEKRYPKITFSV